jgi:hypothetical protein
MVVVRAGVTVARVATELRPRCVRSSALGGVRPPLHVRLALHTYLSPVGEISARIPFHWPSHRYRLQLVAGS